MKIQFRTYAVEHWHYTKSAHVGYVFFFPAMLYIFMPARIKHQKKAFFIVYGEKNMECRKIDIMHWSSDDFHSAAESKIHNSKPNRR